MFTKISSLKILLVVDELIKGKSTLIISPELQKWVWKSEPLRGLTPSLWDVPEEECLTYLSEAVVFQMLGSLRPSFFPEKDVNCSMLPRRAFVFRSFSVSSRKSLLLLVSRISKHISGVGNPDSVSSHTCVQQTFPCLPWSGWPGVVLAGFVHTAN